MATEKKQAKKVDTSIPMSERYPMNIATQLFDAWQLLKRYGDPGRIEKEKDISRPIIDRALKYGHVKDPIVTKKINEFFTKRVELENNSGNKFIASAKKG